MDSIGEKLKTARESRKLSLSDVTKETNISQIYIEALENEDFDRFPSETHAIGFLRNYSEYLKLDAEGIIQSYKGYKIGESATPLEELTKPTGGLPSLKVPSLQNAGKGLYIAAGAVALVAVIILIGKLTSSGVDTSDSGSVDEMKTAYTSVPGKEKFDNIQSLKLSDDKGNILAGSGEAIQFLVDAKECIFLVKKISGNTAEIETYPDKKTYALSPEVPVKLPFAGTSRDVTLTLKVLAETKAKFLLELGPSAAVAPIVPSQVEISPSVDTTRVVAQDERNLKIIFEADFQDKTYFELYLDGQQRNTGIMLAGRKERWEAINTVQVKIGNAGGVKVRINGKDFAFGGKGQVASKIVKWEKDPANPNVFNISVKDWK